MAFNPFEAFSIRSRLGRAVMAVLGIVVMLTFVLSTGAVGTRNDFFDQLLTAFSSRGKGDVLATGYGEDIREADLQELGRQRRAANMFLISAIESGYTEWARDLERDVNGTRLSPDTKSALSQFVSLRAKSDADPRAYQMFLFNPQNVQRIAIAQLLAKPDSDDKKALDAAMAILAHDLLSRGPQLPPVLPDLSYERDKDLIDFALLLKKADRLDIRYSPEAVRDLVQQETGGRLTKEDNATIERNLRQAHQFEGITGDWLITALGNEFRARSALQALQGQSPVVLGLREQRNYYLNQLFRFPATGSRPLGDTDIASAPPGGLTPHEFFEFYKDRCSEHTFSVLELRAEAFLDQVKEEPTPKERVELFNKFRGELPDPARPSPGFKEPRKVKVEFVTLDATAPRIAQAIPKVQAASTILSALAGPMSVGGNGVTALVQASHPALAETLPVRAAVSQKMQENLSPYGPIEQWEFNPRDVSIYRPQPIISALGVLAGGPDVATLTAAVAAARQHVVLHDLRTRVPILMQPVLTPFNPTLGNALGLPAFAYALNPKLPPEGLYLGTVTADLKKRQRQSLFEADVRHLTQKLDELSTPNLVLGQKTDKAKEDKAREDARKLMTEWVKERGLTPAGTKEPRDQWSLVGDPDLKPLNEKAVPEPDGTNSLVKQLFETESPMFGGRSNRFVVQPLRPFWFPTEPIGNDLDKPNFFVWVSEEVEARTFQNLDIADKLTNGEMTKRVVRAWKLDRARKLAQAAADQLAEEVRAICKTAATNPDGAQKQLRDLAEQRKARKFELERLALLKFQHEATQARMGYERPKIDKSLVLYPTDNFVDQLLELRKEPAGGVRVLADAPRTRFFVACEVQRVEKTVDQFREVFDKVTGTGPAKNPLYDQFALPEERVRAVQDVLARLRAEAGLQEKDALKNREKRDTE